MRMRLGLLLFAVALLFSTVMPIAAQQAGTISGRVTDQRAVPVWRAPASRRRRAAAVSWQPA